MIRENEVYRIGTLGRPHGIHGELNFQFTDDIFDRLDADYLILEVDGILVPFFIEEYRFRSDSTALLKLCDIDTQDEARRLTNTPVFFERRLAEGEEPSQAAIVGYRLVNDADGQVVGTIDAIDDSTANTLFELHNGRLIPVAEEFIRNIDNDKKEIRVSLPDGLLDL